MKLIQTPTTPTTQPPPGYGQRPYPGIPLILSITLTSVDQVMPMETEVVNFVSMDYDEDTDTMVVELPLPDADKESIDLQVYRDWFALRALKVNTKEAEYMGQFSLCCAIEPESVTATYEDGILSIRFPFDEEAARPKRVAIN